MTSARFPVSLLSSSSSAARSSLALSSSSTRSPALLSFSSHSSRALPSSSSRSSLPLSSSTTSSSPIPPSTYSSRPLSSASSCPSPPSLQSSPCPFSGTCECFNGGYPLPSLSISSSSTSSPLSSRLSFPFPPWTRPRQRACCFSTSPFDLPLHSNRTTTTDSERRRVSFPLLDSRTPSTSPMSRDREEDGRDAEEEEGEGEVGRRLGGTGTIAADDERRRRTRRERKKKDLPDHFPVLLASLPFDPKNIPSNTFPSTSASVDGLECMYTSDRTSGNVQDKSVHTPYLYLDPVGVYMPVLQHCSQIPGSLGGGRTRRKRGRRRRKRRRCRCRRFGKISFV